MMQEQQAHRLKNEFAFFQSLLGLFLLTYFVKMYVNTSEFEFEAMQRAIFKYRK